MLIDLKVYDTYIDYSDQSANIVFLNSRQELFVFKIDPDDYQKIEILKQIKKDDLGYYFSGIKLVGSLLELLNISTCHLEFNHSYPFFPELIVRNKNNKDTAIDVSFSDFYALNRHYKLTLFGQSDDISKFKKDKELVINSIQQQNIDLNWALQYMINHRQMDMISIHNLFCNLEPKIQIEQIAIFLKYREN